MPKKYKFGIYVKKRKIATLTTRTPYLQIGKRKFKYRNIR